MTNPIRILLVDDSPYFLEVARDFLAYQESFTVVGVATEGDEAIARSRELQPDVILLDLNLARSSGLDLIPVFRRNLPGAKIIVLTMMEETSYRPAALLAGADDFVPKNDMGNRLVTVIHSLMGRSEPALTSSRAEESKRLGERFYQSILEDISELIIRFLPDGTLTYANDVYCRYYGKSREELIGSNFIDAAADDFPQKLREHFRSFTPEQPVSTFEQFDILPNGEMRWREWVDRAFFGDDGRIVEFQSTGRDITERKRIEAELRGSQAQLAGVIHSTMDALITIDEDHRITLFNPAAEQMFKCPASEAVSSPLERFIPEAVRGKHRGFVRAYGRSGETRRTMQTRTLDLTCLRADGTLFPGEISISQFEANDRKTFIASVRDVTERKRAEDALREGERRYRLLFEANPHPMWVYDLESLRFLAVNDAAMVHYGYSREEFLGMTLLDIRPPEDRARLLDNVAAVTEGLDEAGDWRHIKKDGSLIDVEITSHTLDFDGYRAEVVLVNDITERKRAEEKLAASEAELRALFAAMRDVVLIIDRDGVYRKIAPTDPALLYRPPEELLGKTLQDVFPPEEAEKFLAATHRVLETKQVEQIEYELPINGRRVWFSASITPMTKDTTVWVARDVTERKHAEERIQNQLNRLNALREIDLAITSTFDMRVSLDILLSQTVKHLSVDAASVLLLDASTGVLKFEAGIGFRTNAPRSANVKLGKSYAGKAALERRVVRIQHLTDEPDNLLLTAHWKGENFVSYHAMPLIVKGKVLGVLEVFHRSTVNHDEEWYEFFELLAGQAAIAVDNTQLFSASQRELMERRRAEEELRKLNTELEERVEERTTDLKRLNLELERAVRVKDEFLANMSHELRTPLNAIIGLSESLAEKTVGELNEKQAKYVGVIAESGQHLLELINDILDLAKIEAGQIRLDRDKVNVSAVCQSGLRMIHQLANKKNLEVSFEMDAGLGLIRADERRLKQMLVNLLSNAVKFTPEGGRIGLEVRGNRRANIVQFIVWDTGIGIEEDDLERLFRPFVQLDSEFSRKITGTGLGLALVAQMARLHGGGVSVESQPGKGSRFTITLPWESAAITGSLPRRATERLSAEKPGTERARRTILLVEDTEDVIVLIGDYLEHAGYKVEVARNGLDGIAQARKVRPDLILMDIQMPDMDGLEATRQLRTEGGFERTPIIALTALAMPGDRDRALAAGMDEYISKPINLKSMLKVIQRFLAGEENPGE
ncbi:MAG: PAS domain S-box protein [Anaerolineales bacterium]|nr:PAS domain S-box protein [Anaerolineales bacterium]NUQ86474.1 PAS domain S-box protein [Anaerolineales bacterium]